MPVRRTHLSLFSGIGGPDLAAEWMGWENISHTEWNPFGQRVLQYYWPNATSHHDITKTDYTIYRGRVDILTGGFPCQGFSLAGKRMGTDDDRYLWPEMRRAYQECRPRVIIGENVTGLLSMEDKSGIYRDVFPQVEGRTLIRTLEADHYEAVYTRQAKMLIGSICEDLEEDGYEVIPFVIPAAAVGAPHRRNRVFIIAYTNRDGYGRELQYSKAGCSSSKGAEKQKERQRVWADPGRNVFAENVTNSFGFRPEEMELQRENTVGSVFGSTGPEGQYGRWDNWPTQHPVCNGNDGLSFQLDGITFSKWRSECLKAGGNAIVPQVMHEIFKMIDEIL